MDSFYVYQHTRLDTNEVFYIGVGTKQKRDAGYYRANTDKSRNKIWERVVAKTDYRVDILSDKPTKESALKAEIDLIKFHGKIIDKTGTLVNITNGGDGVWGLKMSDSAKEKMRFAKAGFKHSAEAKEKIRIASTGRHHSEDSKLKMSKMHKGVSRGVGLKRTQEFKDKLSLLKTGLKHTQETKNKLSTYRTGRVGIGKGTIIAYQNGIEIKRFERLKFAAEALNIQKQLISKVLSGARKQTGGYTFKRINYV